MEEMVRKTRRSSGVVSDAEVAPAEEEEDFDQIQSEKGMQDEMPMPSTPIVEDEDMPRPAEPLSPSEFEEMMPEPERPSISTQDSTFSLGAVNDLEREFLQKAEDTRQEQGSDLAPSSSKWHAHTVKVLEIIKRNMEDG